VADAGFTPLEALWSAIVGPARFADCRTRLVVSPPERSSTWFCSTPIRSTISATLDRSKPLAPAHSIMDDARRLAEALHANDVATVDAILSANAGLRAYLTRPLPHDPFGATVLTHPTTRGDLAMVDVLIRHGADINQRSDWWAGSFGVLDMCDRAIAPALIARGARVSAHAAARLGMLDALVQLLDADPSLVHARGGDGQTPLHVAANVEIARELVQRGADIDALDIDHESTPAQYMVRDRQDVARWLVTRGCRTDILMAAALGALELAQKHLIARPESLRTRVSSEWFPMQDKRAGGTIYIWTLGQGASPHSVARTFGHNDIYEYLISQSPDDLKLVRAAQSGDEPLVTRLLAGRTTNLAASLSDGDRQGLVVAASRGDTTAALLMLRAGWPTDGRGESGGTPLHWAAWMGNPELARDLVQRGAALEDRGDVYKMTPLGWALHGSLNCWRKEKGDYAETVQVLLAAGANAPEVSAGVDASDEALGALRGFPSR
jgi:ankyrin repeat protein